MPEFIAQMVQKIKTEMRKAVVGQEEVIEQILIAVLVGGHALVEGVPGTAKTLMVKTLSYILGADFRRVQFTPDLMPSDITGTNVFNLSNSTFTLKQGPVFTDFLLADEINRTPPKTQAALLEAMEERQVTIDGERLPLSPLFTVLATQNPVEYEGTYPLPEAQLDRFLIKILIGYPALEEERQIVQRYHQGFDPHQLEKLGLGRLPDKKVIGEARQHLQRITVDESIINYILNINQLTRQSPYLILGGSPRAAIALFQTSKALAALRGKSFVTPDEVKVMSKPVFRHRLILKPEAEIEGLTADQVMEGILAQVEVPR
jgi:MoxR-like ATPase